MPNKIRYWKHPERERAQAIKDKRTPRSRYAQYKANAKQRALIFSITFDEFMTLWQKPCRYCGQPIETIGLDRIENDKGYSFDNVTSCCTTCNRMKFQSGHADFIEHVRRIIAYTG